MSLRGTTNFNRLLFLGLFKSSCSATAAPTLAERGAGWKPRNPGSVRGSVRGPRLPTAEHAPSELPTAHAASAVRASSTGKIVTIKQILHYLAEIIAKRRLWAHARTRSNTNELPKRAAGSAARGGPGAPGQRQQQRPPRSPPPQVPHAGPGPPVPTAAGPAGEAEAAAALPARATPRPPRQAGRSPWRSRRAARRCGWRLSAWLGSGRASARTAPASSARSGSWARGGGAEQSEARRSGAGGGSFRRSGPGRANTPWRHRGSAAPGPRPPRAPRACAPRPGSAPPPPIGPPRQAPPSAPPHRASPLPGSLEPQPGRALCPRAPPAARGRHAERAAGREGAEGPGGPWGRAPLRASPEPFPSPRRVPRVSSSARVPLTGICSLRWVCAPQPSARALRSPGRTGSLRTPLRTKHKAVPQPLPSVLPRPKMLKHPTYTCPDRTEHVDSDRLEYPPSLLIKTDPAYPLSRTSGFSQHVVGQSPW